MRYIFLTIILFQHYIVVNAQNVGIGTASPQTQLHVNNATGNSIIRTEANGTATQAALELKTGAAPFDFLELRKWIDGSGGTQAGISLNGLSTINTGINSTAGLLIGTKPAQPIYFTTDNTERMQINALGNVRIGNTFGGNNRFVVTTNAGSAIVGQTSYIPPPGTFASSISGRINNNAVAGAAVIGITENAVLSTAGIPSGMYGVVGTAIDQGYAVGAFSTSGAGGIYASTFGTGKALRTQGAIQFEGLGAGLGKVLTSDAAGNATWQNISGSSHDHFGESWTGNTSFAGLSVTNNSSTSNASGITGISSGVGGIGVRGNSSDDFGIGVSGIVFHSGVPFPPSQSNSGVQGINSTGNGVYASSMTGYALQALKQNWASVTGPVALLKNERITNNSPVVLIQNEATNPTALELNNGYIKVSGTNKMAFVHTTAASNIITNYTNVIYPNDSPTDMLFVTHSYGPSSTYFNYNYGVWWTGTNWSIFIETPATPMPVNIHFNVMVIKQ